MGSTQNHNSRKFVKVNDKLVLEWFQSRFFFEKTCGEMNRKHELVARLGSSIKCLSCPLNFQSSNQTKRWEFQNYFKLVFLNLGLRFLFGFIKCMCTLNQGPLNIWTELFPNFHFLKLQLRTQEGPQDPLGGLYGLKKFTSRGDRS